MENDKEINITYETLFEILRIEKDKEELQKLNDSFFTDVIAYLRDKENAINSATLEAIGDKKKLEEELDNIKKILKDLYERREKKIVNLALNISRTKSNLIDISGLLKEEKELFDSLISLLDNGRDSILNKLLESRIPYFKSKVSVPETKEEQTANDVPKEEAQKEQSPLASAQPEVSVAAEPETGNEENTEAKKEVNGTKMIRFVNAVPKFVGKELEEYGPFEEEDVANLPAEIANVLIGKGRAEEIEEQ
jgi:DNA replication initiation complex subunit (GINS family)